MLGKVGDAVNGKAYTQKDIDFIRSFYGRMPITKLAKRLGRAPHSIRRIAQLNGIYIERGDVPWERLTELLGVTRDAILWRINTATSNDDVFPHDRIGRFYHFFEPDIMDWLRRGHILTFDPLALCPDLQRMYDKVRRQYYTNAELTAMDLALRIRQNDAITPKFHARYYGSFYDRRDVWALWWSRGHVMPPSTDPYVNAIRTAWHATYASKMELKKYFERTTVTSMAKRFPGSTFRGIRKDALHAYFTQRGDHEMARRFAEKPIHYMELINEIERKAQR